MLSFTLTPDHGWVMAVAISSTLFMTYLGGKGMTGRGEFIRVINPHESSLLLTNGQINPHNAHK